MRFWEAMKSLEEGKIVKMVENDATFSNFESLSYEFSDLSRRQIENCMHLEWEVYSEPTKTYTFQEIIPFLKEGKKVKRMEWNLDLPILLNGCGDIVDTDGCLVGSCIRDLEASDWIVVE